MSRPCKASSLNLVLALLVACDGGSGDTTGSDTSTATSSAAVTTGDAATTDAPTGGTEAPPATTGTGDATTTEDTGESPSTGTSTGADACADSIVTWDNFGESFFLTWCTGCHHSALPSAERACAPCGANFDTHAGASERAQIIQLKVLDYMTVEGVTPMPPAAVIPEDELALLREWIECGAPGPESGVAGAACPDPGAPVDGC